MDKIAKTKGITNPYKKLGLVDNEKVRVETLKEACNFFDCDLKTRKRGKTLVNNIFHSNEKLKVLLSKSTISPKDNMIIHNLIEKDIENLQKDLGIKKKTDEIKEKKSKEYRSFTGLNLRKVSKDFAKNKVGVPLGKKTAEFASNHKMKVVLASGVVAMTCFVAVSDLKQAEDKRSSAQENTQSVLEYQQNEPGNVIFIPKNLDVNDYATFVDTVSSKTLSKELKVDINSPEFKDFDNLYGKYMHKLQGMNQTSKGLKLTKDEGKAFLVMQYMATNNYVDYLKDKQGNLNGEDKERNEYLVAVYRNQLNLIERAVKDLNGGREGKKERKIKSGNDYFTYHVDMGGDFVIKGLEKKVFKY